MRNAECGIAGVDEFRMRNGINNEGAKTQRMNLDRAEQRLIEGRAKLRQERQQPTGTTQRADELRQTNQ